MIKSLKLYRNDDGGRVTHLHVDGAPVNIRGVEIRARTYADGRVVVTMDSPGSVVALPSMGLELPAAWSCKTPLQGPDGTPVDYEGSRLWPITCKTYLPIYGEGVQMPPNTRVAFYFYEKAWGAVEEPTGNFRTAMFEHSVLMGATQHHTAPTAFQNIEAWRKRCPGGVDEGSMLEAFARPTVAGKRKGYTFPPVSPYSLGGGPSPEARGCGSGHYDTDMGFLLANGDPLDFEWNTQAFLQAARWRATVGLCQGGFWGGIAAYEKSQPGPSGRADWPGHPRVAAMSHNFGLSVFVAAMLWPNDPVLQEAAEKMSERLLNPQRPVFDAVYESRPVHRWLDMLHAAHAWSGAERYRLEAFKILETVEGLMDTHGTDYLPWFPPSQSTDLRATPWQDAGCMEALRRWMETDKEFRERFAPLWSRLALYALRNHVDLTGPSPRVAYQTRRDGTIIWSHHSLVLAHYVPIFARIAEASGDKTDRVKAARAAVALADWIESRLFKGRTGSWWAPLGSVGAKEAGQYLRYLTPDTLHTVERVRWMVGER